jgi:hypothetical protein
MPVRNQLACSVHEDKGLDSFFVSLSYVQVKDTSSTLLEQDPYALRCVLWHKAWPQTMGACNAAQAQPSVG